MMKYFYLCLAICFLGLSACKDTASTESGSDAAASDGVVSASQREALIATLEEIDASIVSGDAGRMKEAMAPEAYQRALGTAMGVPDSGMDAFLVGLDSTMDQVFTVSTFEEHDIDYDRVTFILGEGGKPIAKIPFKMRMKVYDQNFAVDGSYFAVLRDNWLVLSPSDEQTAGLLKTAFPELSNQDVPANSMTKLDETP